MRFRRLKLSLVICISILIAVGFILPAVNSALRKWPKLGGEFHDVDINTGRTRQVRYLLYCKTSEKIEDSILTRTIGQFPNGNQPNWQRVNTFPIIGRRYSPHYVYHSAISQIRQVELIGQLYPFSDEAKTYMARTILDRWQSDRGDFDAENYIRDVWDTAREKTESYPKAIISLADLIAIYNEK